MIHFSKPGSRRGKVDFQDDTSSESSRNREMDMEFESPNHPAFSSRRSEPFPRHPLVVRSAPQFRTSVPHWQPDRFRISVFPPVFQRKLLSGSHESCRWHGLVCNTASDGTALGMARRRVSPRFGKADGTRSVPTTLSGSAWRFRQPFLEVPNRVLAHAG